MTPWRWSRSSARSHSQATEGPSGDPLDRPPSYATLPLASSTQSTGAGDGASLRSVTSHMSQLSTPSYATHDRTDRPSSVSFPNPPRYSGLLGTAVGGSSREPCDQLYYSYPIRSGLKSEPWATLRLYDADSSSSRTSKRGRHPRFSNKDVMLGHVELSLSHSQVVRNIELVLKGSIVTGSIGDGGAMTFLDHSYTLWDRKFGDPQLLPHEHLQRSAGKGYDGKLSGNWVFPFAIPFPDLVDLATLRAVYEDEGPVRFLPEALSAGQVDVHATGGQHRPSHSRNGYCNHDPDSHSSPPAGVLGGSSNITPFDIKQGSDAHERPPTQILPVGAQAGGSNNITPFDIKYEQEFSEHPPTGFVPAGTPGGSSDITPFDISQGSQYPERSSTHFVPIVSTAPAPTSPLIEPYPLQQPSSSSPRRAVFGKLGHPSPPPSTRSTPSHSYRGATSMQTLEPLVSDAGHALPQSFLEGGIMANNHYELSLTITHGRFSTKSRVKTTVIYEPNTIPPSMALARQMAYRRREVPRGPGLEPAGWKQLPPVSITGTYLDQRELTVQYKLFLAKPLSYARGTVIPCCLAISCDDASALDLLGNPRTPRVRLRRFTRFLSNQAKITEDDVGPAFVLGIKGQSTNAPGNPKFSDTPLQLAQRSKLERGPSYLSSVSSGTSAIEPFMSSVTGEHGDEEGIIGSSSRDYEQVAGKGAVWCTPLSFSQEPQMRTLYGEIHLPKRLQPTCRFPLFNILYCVELLAPATNAFAPNVSHKLSANEGKPQASEAGYAGDSQGNGGTVYASQFVEITTHSRQDEPVPISFIQATGTG